MRTTYFRKQIPRCRDPGDGVLGLQRGQRSFTCSASNACDGMTPTPPAAPPAGTAMGPCDIYAADGGPCVAAHSTARALYATYNGPLYQVKKADGTTQDIASRRRGRLRQLRPTRTRSAASTACTISIIYDQSGRGNHLTKAPAGMAKTTPDNEANAKAVPADARRPEGLRRPHRARDSATATTPPVAPRPATKPRPSTWSSPATLQRRLLLRLRQRGAQQPRQRRRHDGGRLLRQCTIWGNGAGNGPWVMGDLENGLWAGRLEPLHRTTSRSRPGSTSRAW